MPANYSTLSVGLVTKALTKKHPGSSLPNSVMPRNLFPTFTRHTWPNLALCQVFLKALISGVFHFFKDHTYNFYVQETSLLLFYSLSVESKSTPAILASILSRQQAILSWNPHCSLNSAFHSSCHSWIPNKEKEMSWNPHALHPSSPLPSDPNSTSDSTSSRFRFLACAFSNFP